MGGLITARYAQRYGDEPSADPVGPVIGAWELPERLLALEEIPDTPRQPRRTVPGPGRGRRLRGRSAGLARAHEAATVEAFARTLKTVAQDGIVGRLPLLWLHGGDDRLVPRPAAASGWSG